MARKNGATIQDTVVKVPEMKIEGLEITLVGDSPLICHRWSEKAKKQMRDKQMKKAVGGKEAKNPEQDFRESLYPLPGKGKYGFPAVAFKAAAVDAATYLDGAKKTQLRGAFHIDGELVPLTGTPTMREDMCKIGMGTADLRYRGEFKDWKAKLRIRFNAAAISAEQIVNLFQTAGFSVGVGEWRPQRDGSYGMFHVQW